MKQVRGPLIGDSGWHVYGVHYDREWSFSVKDWEGNTVALGGYGTTARENMAVMAGAAEARSLLQEALPVLPPELADKVRELLANTTTG